jgi:signal transduction histidine kinase
VTLAPTVHGSPPVEPANETRGFWVNHPRLSLWLPPAFNLLLGAALISGNSMGPSQWLSLGVNSAISFVLLARRSHTWTVLAVVGVADVAVDFVLAVPLAVAAYSVGVHRPARPGAVAVTAVLAATVVKAGVEHGIEGAVSTTVLLGAALGIAFLLGTNVATRQRYLGALLDRAARLAREKEQEGELAAGRERARIARDMHDIIAHNLTMMVLLSDGANAIAATDPQRSRETVERVADIGRDAMRDMRRLLGVLRDGGEDAPEDLDVLIENFRLAGLPVALRQRGTETLSAGLRRVLFRVVQESLTNALRYADHPTQVLVDIDYAPDRLNVEIVDDGRATHPVPSVGSGQGLIALRERVALYGGTVETGRRPVGWAVQVTLPYAEASE